MKIYITGYSGFLGSYLSKHLAKKFTIKKVNLRKMKTLEVLAYAIYHKFLSNPQRKTSINDIIDVLIMTTVPYVHTFISERNSINILKQLKKQSIYSFLGSGRQSESETAHKNYD